MCTNCDGTEKVKLRNDRGQVYEIRICPICCCKVCKGAKWITKVGHTPGHGGIPIIDREPCYACRPERFSQHVRLFKRRVRQGLCGYSPTNTPIVYRDSVSLIAHSPEFYEQVYRNCLNPFKRLKRWLTHNMDGTPRCKH